MQDYPYPRYPNRDEVPEVIDTYECEVDVIMPLRAEMFAIEHKVRLLKDALEILRHEPNWTKGWWARDKYGEILPTAWQEDACRWCLSGVFDHLLRGPAPYDLFQDEAGPSLDIMKNFNDDPYTTHHGVVCYLSDVLKYMEARLVG